MLKSIHGTVKWGEQCDRAGGWAPGWDPGWLNWARSCSTGGLTAEYTWPGSFRPCRDNWGRLSVQLRSNLTQAIVCGGRSTHSVWPRRNAKVCGLCTFMHWRWLQMSTAANNCLLALSVKGIKVQNYWKENRNDVNSYMKRSKLGAPVPTQCVDLPIKVALTSIFILIRVLNTTPEFLKLFSQPAATSFNLTSVSQFLWVKFLLTPLIHTQAWSIWYPEWNLHLCSVMPLSQITLRDCLLCII